MLADLIAPHLSKGADVDGGLEGGLEDEELDILREAGIISGKFSGRAPKRSTKHIVFVDNESEGLFYFYYCIMFFAHVPFW